MRDAGHNFGIQLLDDRVDRHAGLGRFRRQRRANFSRIHRRQYRKLVDACVVVCEPIDQSLSAFAEFVGLHVK